MSNVFSIIFAVLLFSFLILIHELGHFAAAKLSGVQVNEFSMFMGPIIWQKKYGQTLYSLRLIPFGGFCAMEGEDGDSDNPHAFGKAAWWKRLIILVAGAAMNFLAGVALMVVVCLPVKTEVEPVISNLEPYCSMAGENGIQQGDRILKIDGERIYLISDFTMFVELNRKDIPGATQEEQLAHKGQRHDLLVERGGKKVLLKDLMMEKSKVTQADGSERYMFGLIFTEKKMDFPAKLSYAWRQTMNTVRTVRLSLQMLLTGKAGLKDVGGPVLIVQQMSQVATSSKTAMDALMNMLYFGAFIAINLAVMNLLPVPALDGGRVVGLLITTGVEAVTRKKIDPKYEGYLHGAGMLLLLALMAVVMFKDIFFLLR